MYLSYLHNHDMDRCTSTLLSTHFASLQDNYVSLKHEGDKLVVFDRGTCRGPAVFVFNFHTTSSYTGYRIGVPALGE